MCETLSIGVKCFWLAAHGHAQHLVHAHRGAGQGRGRLPPPWCTLTGVLPVDAGHLVPFVACPSCCLPTKQTAFAERPCAHAPFTVVEQERGGAGRCAQRRPASGCGCPSQRRTRSWVTSSRPSCARAAQTAPPATSMRDWPRCFGAGVAQLRIAHAAHAAHADAPWGVCGTCSSCVADLCLTNVDEWNRTLP